MNRQTSSTESNTEKFAGFAETMQNDSPLYAEIARTIATHEAVANLIDLSPDPQQRIPVLLFAAVHDLVLGRPDLPLGRWYPTVTDEPRTDDAGAAFVETCHEYRDALSETIATRQTQTNEVGRAAAFLPALAEIAAPREARAGVGPLSLVDVGTSAGLNLALDRFHYDYESSDDSPGGTIGPADSPVRLTAATERFTAPPHMPSIAARRGLDRHPIDVRDPAQQRWLEACVWADQIHRFHRLQGAIALTVENPPDLVQGDAVAGLTEVVERAAEDGHPVVMNSWVLNYLTPEARREYIARLGQFGADNDLSWVYFESPDWAPELPWPDGPLAMPHATYLMLATWRAGQFGLRHLAICHPHGRRIHWVG